MFRGNIEAKERARVSGSDYNERCDQRHIIDCEVVNIYGITDGLADRCTINAADNRSPRSRSPCRVSWYFAIVAWAALIGSAAAIPLVGAGSQTTIVAADSVIAGALISFVGWRVSAWASAILTRMARAPDASGSRDRSL
jgi:hypothetical protein